MTEGLIQDEFRLFYRNLKKNTLKPNEIGSFKNAPEILRVTQFIKMVQQKIIMKVPYEDRPAVISNSHLNDRH